MKETKGNIFELMNDASVDSICITTNGIVNAEGLAIMGAGTAGEAARRWPGVRKNLGKALNASGNFPFVIGIIDADGNFVDSSRRLISEKKFKLLIWSFPTKNDFRDDSDVELIKQSCKMLYDRTKALGLKNILVPAPGTGKNTGRLDWATQVKPAIENLLDDRFTITFLE